MSDDEDFGNVNAGSSSTYPMPTSGLRKGGHVVIKGRPCKIVELSPLDDGRVYMAGIDIFSGRKLVEGVPSYDNVDVPNVSRIEYQLVNIDDGYLNLMTLDGTPKDDVKVPKGDLGSMITQDFEAGRDLLVTVVAAMGEEQCISFKEAPKTT